MTDPVPAGTAATEKDIHAAHLRTQLLRAVTLRKAANADPALAQDRLALREWQAQRLARTHRDLLESKQSREAAKFFLADLYGPRDFSERDHELERVLPMVISFLPAAGVQTVALAVEVDAISEDMDQGMVRVLRNTRHMDAIDDDTYAAAYRTCDNRPARERQIELIAATGQALARLTRKPLIAGGIRLMRGPAHAAGLGALHDFLERGFQAFRGMGNTTEFLDTVCGRERTIMERLFAGQSPQFDQLPG
jgi:hypothetical protein